MPWHGVLANGRGMAMAGTALLLILQPCAHVIVGSHRSWQECLPELRQIYNHQQPYQARALLDFWSNSQELLLQVGTALGQLLALGACCMPCVLQLQPSGVEFQQPALTGPHLPSVVGSALACAASKEYSALHAQVPLRIRGVCFVEIYGAQGLGTPVRWGLACSNASRLRALSAFSPCLHGKL